MNYSGRMRRNSNLMATTKKTVKVTQSVIIAHSDSISMIQCLMNDGSIWLTDSNGKNWRQIKKPDNELTEIFNNWLEQQAEV